MITLNPDALLVKPPSLIEVRITVGRRLSSIALDMTSCDLDQAEAGNVVTIQGKLVGADFSNFDDGRLDRQLRSIERLYAHLEGHCPQLIDPRNKCPHLET